MTELKWSDRDKVIDFDIAQELVGELSACEHDWAIYEELRRYAIRIADEDDKRGGYITLEDLFDCMEQAFRWEDECAIDKLDLLKTIEGVA